MNVLETILHFLTTLAQIIFPRRKRPAAGDCPCPNPHPAPDRPALPADAGDGSDLGRPGRDPLAAQDTTTGKQPPEADWLGISGYGLMLAGGVGCVLKHLL